MKYEKRASEYGNSGDMVGISPKILPNVAVASKWILEPCFLPQRYEKIAGKILNFEVRKDDVWVISYPKCGTTWTQEMVTLLCTDLDYGEAANIPLIHRWHFLEFESIFEKMESIDKAAAAPSPRYMKSHLPVGLLPVQLWTVCPKIVYVARNPMDTAISYYHHLRNVMQMEAKLDEYYEAFLADQIVWSPFHSHIISFWNMRNEENISFITYEDMKFDMISVLKFLANFFGKTYKEDELKELMSHLSFEKMTSNESCNNGDVKEFVQHIFGRAMPDEDFKFMRKGQAGGYKGDMSPELIERFTKWTQEKIKDSDLRFVL